MMMSLAEARRLIACSQNNPAAMLMASHTICESPESTLKDLLDAASLSYRSAAWRPTLILHERTGVPPCFENGQLVIDLEFWRDYLARQRSNS